MKPRIVAFCARVSRVDMSHGCSDRAAKQRNPLLCVFQEGYVVAIRREASPGIVAQVRQSLFFGTQHDLVGAKTTSRHDYLVRQYSFGTRPLASLEPVLRLMNGVVDLVTSARKGLD